MLFFHSNKSKRISKIFELKAEIYYNIELKKQLKQYQIKFDEYKENIETKIENQTINIQQIQLRFDTQIEEQKEQDKNFENGGIGYGTKGEGNDGQCGKIYGEETLLKQIHFGSGGKKQKIFIILRKWCKCEIFELF
ncbi:hypothetical protein RFI_30880 [Reticulomyxa filosa]|uniref:Uncharacterized protein n=1 Tax=Reticulomyxa filosa TaxID=46433 RepID=X6LYT4_RETFI|nr:hypothetical protein RFI_30880 [Reticulomyxa filosa]|eukprot:ETO06511.1 hypothetical protein RFI_30880 [Reticulomyxa filosa]